MGHAPDHLKSHSGPQTCLVHHSLKCLHTRDGRGRGEEGSFGGSEEPIRGCVVPGPGRSGPQPDPLPASGHQPTLWHCSALPVLPAEGRVGAPSPRKASLLEPLALCPKAGDLGKPKCFPTGKRPPPAPEASSVTPALPGTPPSLYALRSPLPSQETHLCIPWSVNNTEPQTGKAPWKPARFDCPLGGAQNCSPTKKALESKILCHPLSSCRTWCYGEAQGNFSPSPPPDGLALLGWSLNWSEW